MPPALETIAFAIMIAAASVQWSVAYVLWTELWFGPIAFVGRAWGGWLWPRTPVIAVVSMLSHVVAATLLVLASPGFPAAAYGGIALLLAIALPIGLRRLERVTEGTGRHTRAARSRDRVSD